jgi:hypothetical protein
LLQTKKSEMESMSKPKHESALLLVRGGHRNLRPRTSKLANVFLGKEHVVENQLISTLDRVIYF